MWQSHGERIFRDESPMYSPYEHLSELAKALVDRNGAAYKGVFRLRLGVFYGDTFVGWSTGNQENSDTYYMRNSAIFEEHRRKGLYSALLEESVRRILAAGFQRIMSRHNTDNNAVIIPKLKAGFLITGMEIDDKYGVLVNLSYYPHELRRKVIAYRTGRLHADAEVARVLKLDR